MDLLHDPAFQSSILPLIASFLLVGVLRFSLGSKLGPEFSSLGITIAFVIIYCVVNGVPVFPPRSSTQKLIYIVLASAFLGMIIDLIGRPRIIRPVVLIFLLASLIWLGWNQVIAVNWVAITSILGLILIVVISMLNYLDNSQHQSDTPVVLLVVAIGLGVIALYSSSALIAQLSFALAATIGGFMLWNWPKEHYPFTLIGLLGVSSILFSLTAILLLTGKPNLIGMGLLAIALFSDSVLPGLPTFFQKLPRSVIVVILTLITLVPVTLAALITIIKSPSLTY